MNIAKGQIVFTRDFRKAKIVNITLTRIWCKLQQEESAWNLNGKWRDDGIESCADLILNVQLTLF